MTTYADMGMISYFCNTQPEFAFDPWALTDELVNDGIILCMDSEQSIRKDKYPWYKTNRLTDMTVEAIERRLQIREWRRAAVIRYPLNIRAIAGLEADDLCAMYASPGDTILTEDKDALQLEGIKLVDIHGTEWANKRLEKLSKQGITQGERFISWQLCVGDNTDTIPRLLYTKDRTTIPAIMQTEHPLKTLLGMVNIDKARDHLNCLLTPTPLHTGIDSVLYVERIYNFQLE